MSHIKARVEALRPLVQSIKSAGTIFERSALFSAIHALHGDLLHEDDLNGYAKEKVAGIHWHAGAALGFDETNGHSQEQHIAWAYGELDSLESSIE